MILFSVGLPGSFAQWCDAVIARLAGCLGGEVASTTWPPLSAMFGYGPISSTLDEVGRFLIANPAPHIAVGARQPDEKLRSALANATRFVLALDDPANAVADILAETGMDATAVVRAVANSCPTVLRFAGLPGALAIHAESARRDPTGTVLDMAAHLGIGIATDAAASLAGELNADGVLAWPAGAGKMVEGALAGYRECFVSGRFDQLVWTRELFLLADLGGQAPTGIIGVAGPPRTLIYGPYIQLPPGRWTARATLGFSAEAAGTTFVVEAFANPRQLGHTVLVPQSGGVHTADIEFALDAPSGAGVEVRVTVTSQNAQGQMALGHVILQPLEMHHPDAIARSSDFASVLEL